MARQILVIEDSREIADLVALHLRDAGFDPVVAATGTEGLTRAMSESFDLIVLDLMLPGVDGLEICKRLRARPAYTPILMLTAKTTELDRVLGLELGADDYLTKPFSIMELLARVKALFRRIEAMGARRTGKEEAPIHVGDLTLDLERRRLLVKGDPVPLTAKEFDLLVHFARNPGHVYTRSQLLDTIWGYGHSGYEHTVNSHINRLRAKIEPDPSQPRFILTVWGVGYRFFEPLKGSIEP